MVMHIHLTTSMASIPLVDVRRIVALARALTHFFITHFPNVEDGSSCRKKRGGNNVFLDFSKNVYSHEIILYSSCRAYSFPSSDCIFACGVLCILCELQFAGWFVK